MIVTIKKLSDNYNSTISKGDTCTGTLFQMIINNAERCEKVEIKSFKQLEIGRSLYIRNDSFGSDDKLTFLVTSPVCSVDRISGQRAVVHTANSIYELKKV